MYDVITIGSATRDVFLISDGFQIIKSKQSETGALECVSLGSKIEVDQMTLTTGGGATNAAATFAALGFDAAPIARISDDPPGRGLIQELEEHRINTKLMRVIKNQQTAYSSLLTTKTGERSVLVYRGVSATFRAQDIPWDRLKAKWLYLTSLGGNLALAKRIVSYAHEHNIQIAYNPGMSEIKQGWSALAPLLPKLSVLSLNLEEAAKLTGEPTKELKQILHKFARYNLILLLTDGAQGSWAQLGDEVWFARPSKVKVVSRTGAGDAFGSGFVAAMMKQDDIARALQFATLNAQGVIGSVGAKRGILKRIPDQKTLSKIKISKI